MLNDILQSKIDIENAMNDACDDLKDTSEEFDSSAREMTVGSVLLNSMIYDLGNFTAYDWETSFSKTIDRLEKSYVNRYWKDIDFDSIRSELIPKVRQAQQTGDKIAFSEALYDLKYELFDGHVDVVIKDYDTSYEVSQRLARNDYGLSMFRDSAGEVLAVLVDEKSAAAENGIKNGTVITKWDGQPIDEAASQVRCIDTFYTFSYIENEDIFRPIFLAGKGGDSVEVTFIGDYGKERTAELPKKGNYSSRLHNAIDTVIRGSVIEHNENFYSCMLNDNCGYFRVTREYYYYDGMDYIKAELFDGYEAMRQDIINKMNERLKADSGVVIEHKDFENLIKVYDRSGALFYCDPPYHKTEKYYDAEFKQSDHERLNLCLNSIKGRFILSYNDDEYIRELYKNFNIIAVERQNNLSSGSFKELIITNF